MLRKHKFTLLTFLLAIVLIVPYGLKLLNGSLELYPAIIFPAGPGTVSGNQGTFEFEATNLYCLDLMNEKWERRDTSSFLSPVPNQFFKVIVKNEFGLNSDLKYTVEPRRNIIPSFTYRNVHALSAGNISNTKAWLKSRLLENGCRDDSLLIRKTLMLADLKTKSVSEVKIISERHYKL